MYNKNSFCCLFSGRFEERKTPREMMERSKQRSANTRRARFQCRDQEINIKVAFMGAAKTGKSSLVQRLIGGDFNQDYEPTVFEFYNHESKLDNNSRVCLQISDTSGAFDFPAMDRLTIQKSDVVVVVFDLTSISSLKHVVRLTNQIKQENPKKAVLVIGNKSDLPYRVVHKKELERHVTCIMHHTYVEMSAKCDGNMSELIHRISEEFALSNGPYDVKRSEKPFGAKLKKGLSKSTESLLDLF